MKLATLANGSRDGRLVVVSRDLAYATDARGIANTMQDALDDWASLSPKLEALAAARLTAEEIALIKRLIAKAYNPHFVVKTWEMLDPVTAPVAVPGAGPAK